MVDSHHFSSGSRVEWIDVMVTGSPRTLGKPEVTDTQGAPIQAQKPSTAMISSKEGPSRHTTVNYITPQGRHKDFKVAKRLGMIDKSEFCVGWLFYFGH